MKSNLKNLIHGHLIKMYKVIESNKSNREFLVTMFINLDEM